jgi:hypothetical protein
MTHAKIKYLQGKNKDINAFLVSVCAHSMNGLFFLYILIYSVAMATVNNLSCLPEDHS